jgi:hypothetical protein
MASFLAPEVDLNPMRYFVFVLSLSLWHLAAQAQEVGKNCPANWNCAVSPASASEAGKSAQASIARADASASPIEIVRVEPHSHTRCALAALGSNDSDPWGSCLVITYKNMSSRPVSGVRFEITFLTPLNEPMEAISSEDARKVKPGKTIMAIWRDGVYWQQYGRDQMDANVSVSKVMFEDGTFWTAAPAVDKTKVDLNLVRASFAGYELKYPTIHVSVSGTEASVHADNADLLLCKMTHMNRVSLRMMGLQTAKIVNSQSEICSVDLTD